MKSGIFSWIIALIFFSIYSIKAQEEVVVSKNEVLNKILKGNFALKISEKDFDKAEAAYNQTKAVFLPNITASYTGVITTNPLMSFGSKLNQSILTSVDFNPDLLNNPERTQNFGTKIEIEQPIFNLDGFFQRKAARDKMKAMSLQTKRTADYLELEVEKAYMQLQLAYKVVDVLKKALKTAETHKTIANNNYREGLLKKVDVLTVEIRVVEVKNQLQKAESNILNASNYISFLMNDDEFIVYLPSDSLSITPSKIVANSVSNKRADIKSMELYLKANEAVNKADKMSFLPKLNAFGSYELYDNTTFRGDASGYVVGAQLSWSIFEGSKRIGKRQQSKAALEKSKLVYNQLIAKSNLEFNKAKRQLVDTKSRLVLSQLVLQQTQESLRICKNRFKEGLEKTSDLLKVETQFAQKQLEYYQAIFDYNFTKAYLKFLTKE